MNIDLLVIGNSPIPFLWIFSACMCEEAGTNGLSNPGVIFISEGSARKHWKLKSVHDCN